MGGDGQKAADCLGNKLYGGKEEEEEDGKMGGKGNWKGERGLGEGRKGGGGS